MQFAMDPGAPEAAPAPTGWCQPPRNPRLCGGQVHVWRGRLDVGAAEVARRYRTLAPDELVRAARFVRDADRDRWVAARGFLRMVLAAYLDRAPGDLRFVYGPRDKPALAGRGPLPEFNLSHSGDWALCALAPARHVGVDVERVQHSIDVAELEGTLAPEERTSLAGLESGERVHAFFEAWTRKEAVAKAMGLGVAAGLDRIAVGVRAGDRVAVTTPGHPTTSWSVERVDPADGYAAAVAVERGPWCVLRWDGPPQPPVPERRRAGAGDGGDDLVSLKGGHPTAPPFGIELNR